MKILASTLLLFLSGLTFGQNYHAAVELPEMNIMYRGYNNKVEVAVNNADSSDVVVECSGCEVKKSGSGYVVNPTGRSRELYLSVLVRQKDSLIAIKKIKYRVSNLPYPELYWGGSKNGTKANIRSKKLFAKYPPDIPLNATFKVLSWELQTKNDTITGSGSNLSSTQETLKKITVPSTVTFTAIVMGPDGIRRKKTGTWKVDTWEKSPQYGVIIEKGS